MARVTNQKDAPVSAGWPEIFRAGSTVSDCQKKKAKRCPEKDALNTEAIIDRNMESMHENMLIEA